MQEVITDAPGRRLVLLVARPELTVSFTRHAPGQEGTEPHVHHAHTDGFFVLEGELTVPAGRELTPLVVPAGAFVAAPPEVAHCFRNASAADASWINVHAPGGGFAAFLRGVRDGTAAAWDSADVAPGGGRPATGVRVVSDGAGALRALGVTVAGWDALGASVDVLI